MSIRPRRLIRLLLACLLALVATRADAGGSSSLRLIIDESLAAHTPITIELAPAGESGDSREGRLTTSPLVARFDGIEAGEYSLRVTLADGREVRQWFSMRVGVVAVVAIGPSSDGGVALHATRVDELPVSEGARFDARALRDLPTAGDVWSLVDSAAPFVIADRPDTARLDTGGIGAGRSALVSSRGESWGGTTVLIDGLPVRLPTHTGQLAVLPDMHAAASVTVMSGLAPIDVDTPGVVVDWRPRSAGLSWSGGVDLSATTPGMVGENHLPHAPSLGRLEDWRSAAAYGGGPLGPKAGVFLSGAFSRASYLERQTPPQLKAETRSVFGHLTTRPTNRDQIRALLAVERAEYPFIERWQFANRDVAERSTFGRVQIAWDRSDVETGHLAVALGVQRGAWRPGVESDASGGTVDRVFQGVVPLPASDLTLGQLDGRIEYRTPVLALGAIRRDARIGATLRRTSLQSGVLALPQVAETVAGLPARVWFPDATGPSSRRLVEVGVFAAERWFLGPRFSMDAGLRVDMLRGDNSGDVALNSTTLSPRVSLRWSPGALSVFAGVGRYTGGHPMSMLAFGDPGAATWNVHRWTDANANGVFDADELGVLVARAGSGAGVGSLDPDVRLPRTTEWVVGAEVRPTSMSVLRGSIIIRRQTNLVGVVNTGLTADDYRASFVPDIGHDEGSAHDDQLLPVFERLEDSFGRDALRLTNPDADPVAHDGIEVTYELTSPRWFMIFGATAYRTLGRGGLLGHSVQENDPLIPGDRFWNPNALKDEAGRLFFDRAYVGKWTTGYRAPGDVRLAAVVRYQDGQPFTRFVVAPDLAGGPEITHAYPMGRTRFTYTATIDARAEKGVTFGRGRRLSVRVDVFNLTNHANELEEDVLTGPTFRLSTIVQPPRTLRLGVRMEF